MPATQLRLLMLAWLSLSGVAFAQQDSIAAPAAAETVGTVYEQSRQDVTLPIASAERPSGDNGAAVTVPVEDLATPMRCMTAWSYLAGQVIRASEDMQSIHPDFTEATASAHWQHWLALDLDAHQGALSDDFHQRRLAAERAFSLSLASQEEAYAYRTLGICYVPAIERLVGDPTLLLRNFMVEHQGLPEDYSVPILQRQLRAFPISKTSEEADAESCDAIGESLQETARIDAIIDCFDKGGILASQARSVLEDIDGLCRATASVQCENIP